MRPMPTSAKVLYRPPRYSVGVIWSKLRNGNPRSATGRLAVRAGSLHLEGLGAARARAGAHIADGAFGLLDEAEHFGIRSKRLGHRTLAGKHQAPVIGIQRAVGFSYIRLQKGFVHGARL